MKRISKILLVIIAALFVFNADAFEMGQAFSWGEPIPYSNAGATTFVGRGAAYSANTYRVAGDDYPIYCLDPGASTPEQLFVSRILLDSPQYSAKDMGILYAIKYDPSTTLSTDVRFQKGVAVRLLVDGVYGWSNANARQSDVRDFEAAAQKIIEMKLCETGGIETQLHNGSHGLKLAPADAKGILENFCAGYNAYLNYSKEEAAPNVAARVKSEKRLDGQEGKNFIVEFEMTNFTLDGTNPGEVSFTINPNLVTSGINGYEIKGALVEYQADGDSYDMGLFNTISSSNAIDVPEIKSQLESSNGNAKFYVSIDVFYDEEEATEEGEEEDCNASVEFKYSFTHPRSINGAILRADQGGYDVSSFQRFAIFGPSGDKSIVLPVCNNGPCETSKNLITPICDDADRDKEVDGKVVYSFREGYFKDIDKYDIKKCILNNTDEALNTYQFMNADTASILTDNPYCSLYCKEDYVFNIPYKKNASNGRYFQIDMDIAALQTCYTTKIDKKKVNKKLVELQRELIDAYNEYIFYYYLTKNEPTQDNTIAQPTCNQTYSCTSHGPYQHYDYSTTPATPVGDPYWTFTKDTKDCVANGGTCNQDDPTVSPTPNYRYGSYVFDNVFIYGEDGNEENPEVKNLKDVNNVIPDGAAVKTDNGGPGGATRAIFGGASNGGDDNCQSRSYTGDPDTGTCDYTGENIYPWTNFDDDYDNLKSTFESMKEAAAQRLKQIFDEMETQVIYFDGCAGTGDIKYYTMDESKVSKDWYANFKYAPDITYSYDEPEPGNKAYEGAKWIELARANVPDGDKMLTLEADIYGDFCSHDPSTNSGLGDGVTPTCHDAETITAPDYETGGLNGETLNAKTFCIGDIESDYTCQGELISKGSVKDRVTLYGLIDFNFEVSDPIEYRHQQKWKFTDVNYISTNSSAASTYDTPRIFYTGGPTGDVVVSTTEPTTQANDATVEGNYSLVDGLPVSIKTPLGEYYYKLIFNDIGTYYYSQHTGRIYGEGSSVSDLRPAATLNDNEDLETNAYACTYTVGNTCVDAGGEIHYDTECTDGEGWEACKARMCPNSGGGQYCVQTALHGYCKCPGQSYDESCECTESKSNEDRNRILSEVCSGSEMNDKGEYINCENNYNCCPYCKIECLGDCIIHEDGEEKPESLLEFRPINTAQLNPNNRDLGPNWNPGPTDGEGNYNWSTGAVTNVLVAQKAGITIDEIQSRATISDITSTEASKLGSLTDYALDVTLSPKMATFIKNYNKDALSTGNYNNQTLTCYDYELNYDMDTCKNGGFTWLADDYKKPNDPSAGKCVMENIMCYSSFIDQLQEEFGKEAVDTNHRPSPINISEKDGSSQITEFKGISNKYSNNVQAVSGVQVKNVQDYWGIFRYSTLDINGDKIPDVGPSWK